ncbi:MAG: hypothetical protein M3245_05895 [Actinomycetota bacterium]|nr:hypothetical protein [Actinomycetota bacterium]
MVLVLVAATATAVHGGAPAWADETTRTPPYDFGCVIADGRCVAWTEARNGTLRGGRFLLPNITFPPSPTVATVDYTTTAGVIVNLSERSSFRVSAVLRRTDPISPPALDVAACIGVAALDSSSWSYGGMHCKRLSGNQETRVTREFEDTAWGRTGFDPGRWRFFVALQGAELVGGPSEVRVDSISYDVTPARLLRVKRNGSGSGGVLSQDGMIQCGGMTASGWPEQICSRAYPPGTEVVLTATPAPGSSFEGWTDCQNPDGNVCTEVMGWMGASDKTLTATFQ